MFDTTKEDLKDILRKVDEGKLSFPIFNATTSGVTKTFEA